MAEKFTSWQPVKVTKAKHPHVGTGAIVLDAAPHSSEELKGGRVVSFWRVKLDATNAE